MHLSTAQAGVFLDWLKVYMSIKDAALILWNFLHINNKLPSMYSFSSAIMQMVQYFVSFWGIN